jgi:hypothetical protein
MPRLVGARKVSYSPDEVETFNERYCGRKLPVASYWFEFDELGCLKQTSVTEDQHTYALYCLSQEALAWLEREGGFK